MISHQPLSLQLEAPSLTLVDYGKMNAPSNNLLGFRTLNAFRAKVRMPSREDVGVAWPVTVCLSVSLVPMFLCD